MNTTIKVLQPDMPTAEDLLPYLRSMDRSKVFVNNGPFVQELEELLRRHTGLHCVTMSNATVALELTLRWLFRGKTSTPRVLVPSVTYVASGQAVFNAGAKPVLADVDADTWQLTADMALAAVKTMHVDAVMPVAAFGAPVPIDAWEDFSRKTGIPVVVDAAGALTEQRSPAHENVFVVYSMHATKFWGAGEGGVVSSPDLSALAALRDMACFGHGGTNAKMSEYHAAVGLAAEPALVAKAVQTMKVISYYESQMPGILLASMQAWPPRSNWTLLPVLMPADIGAKPAANYLASRGIETRQWYAPYLHERPQFAGCACVGDLVVADELSDRLLGVPFHTRLSEDDVARVCKALRELVE